MPKGDGGVHAAKDDGHEQGGRLIFRPSARGDSADERLDLEGCQSAAVSFFPKDVDGAHARSLSAGGYRLRQGEVVPGILRHHHA